MLYLSKGIVIKGSTEHILHISRCGVEFALTGDKAALWLSGRFSYGETSDIQQHTHIMQLCRMGLVEATDGVGLLSVFRLLANCVICPAKPKPIHRPLNADERNLLEWICKAGIRLTISELTLLNERGITPEPSLLGETNRQKLTETLYDADTCYDGTLDALMEASSARDKTVCIIMKLLRKKRIIIL